MESSLIAYKSVSIHKPNANPIIAEFIGFYSIEHFSSFRLKDRSHLNGNKAGILGFIAYHNLIKWGKEDG